MQAAWGEGVFLEFAQDYADRVNEMSGGSLVIELHPINTFVKTGQLQSAVHEGYVIDAAHMLTAHWSAKTPSAWLFGAGPCFGWNANQFLGWIKYGGGQTLYNELLRSLGLNITGFFSGPLPAQPLGWFKQPVTGAGQIQGMKYRTIGLAADVMEEMGAEAVRLPGGEIQPAMRGGLIDGAEFSNPESDKNFGMQHIVKHYHLGSFHQSQETFEIIFNRIRYRRMAPEHKAILKYAAESASADMSWKYQDRYSKALESLEKESGVEVRRTPLGVMAGQLRAWDAVTGRIAARDKFFARVIKSQKAWAKRVVRYELLNAPDYKRAYRHYFGGL